MEKSLLLAAAALPLAAQAADRNADRTDNPRPQRPHSILFMVDDMGWQDP